MQGRLFVHFFEDDQAVPHIEWHAGKMKDDDWIRLVVFYYAHVMFELAELNETRVARELMNFVTRISDRISNSAKTSGRIKIPLGKIRVGQEISQPGNRIYQAALFAKKSGAGRMEFAGVIGKEKFFLPASFLVLLQSAIFQIQEGRLEELSRRLTRLNQYYRYKRDFWNSVVLTEGPAFALGNEPVSDPDPEVDIP